MTMPSLSRPPRWLFVAALAGAMGGCQLPPPIYILNEEPPRVAVDQAPPAPRLEVPAPAPDESYVWQDGYWSWDDGAAGYHWVEGQWLPPVEGYVLVGASYDFVDDGWSYQPPYWCHAKRCRHGRRNRHERRPTAQEVQAPDRARVRAPAAEDEAQAPAQARVRAPAAEDEARARVRAPAAEDEARARVRAPAAEDEAQVRVRAPAAEDEAQAVSGPRVIVLQPQGGQVIEIHRPLGARSADDAEPREARPVDERDPKRLQQLPGYRGRTEGRPVFGDDPTQSRRPLPSYRTDATGAIILTPGPQRISPPPQRSRGGIEVLRPERHQPPDPGRQVTPDQVRELPMVVPPQDRRPAPARSGGWSRSHQPADATSQSRISQPPRHSEPVRAVSPPPSRSYREDPASSVSSRSARPQSAAPGAAVRHQSAAPGAAVRHQSTSPSQVRSAPSRASSERSSSSTPSSAGSSSTDSRRRR